MIKTMQPFFLSFNAAVKRAVEPFVNGLPLGVVKSLFGFQRIVNDEVIRASTCQHTAHGSRQTESRCVVTSSCRA